MLVLILGASNKSGRYSNRAMHKLLEHGHELVLLHPRLKNIGAQPVINTLDQVQDQIDTVTVYVNPEHLQPLIPELLKLKPRRFIANPGAESSDLAQAARMAGIQYLEACTLVMLLSGKF